MGGDFAPEKTTQGAIMAANHFGENAEIILFGDKAIIEKKLNHKKNPPQFSVEFFKDQKNLENINCYSNEGGKWEKSNITIKENKLSIKFREPFTPRRGRVNCSLNDDGKWRWFGTQFTIAKDTK